MTVRIVVTDQPLDVPELLSVGGNLGSGAIASFTGLVRPENEKESVLSLEFEAWESKLPEVLNDIAVIASEENDLDSILIAHRTGVVKPGEAIVCIQTCSEHRIGAFNACSWTIDELKRQAPIWKMEHTTSGSRWVEGLG